MTDFTIKIKRGGIKIDKRVFLSLLDLSPIKDYTDYIKAVESNEITISDLKILAQRADVPYPLFFAPKEKVDAQLKDTRKNLFEKLPTKSEMQLALRGEASVADIEIIVKDIGRKQEFLKRRVLPASGDNPYIGSISKLIKRGLSKKDIAEQVRSYFGINLAEMRKLSKDDVLSYICKKAEEKEIFISMSSYNYMPQNLDSNLGLSGLCVRDKKVPYIFVNTRDGDDKPKILETSGRQILTVISMLVCIGINKFLLSTKTGKSSNTDYKRIYSIASEILIPTSELNVIKINSLSDLTSWSRVLKVTPSMLLICLVNAGKISRKLANSYLENLRDAIKEVKPKRRQALPINGYKKYNGERFSKEIISAYKNNKITEGETKNLLFRKGKMDNNLFQEYLSKY